MRSILCALMGTLALAAAGCGDDSGQDMPCGDAAAGAVLSCECEDGGANGQRLCQADGKLSGCDCGGLGSPDGGGRSGSGRAGRGGSGGTSGRSGSSAAGSGGMAGEDAGMMSEPEPAADAGMMMGEPAPLPEDGNQLAVCANGRDCNMDLDCYATGPGRGFCSQVCQAEADCMGLAGATYGCSSGGICNIPCQDEQDMESCPAGMVCLNINGGGNGGEPIFRCKYPPAEPPQPERQPAFGPCMGQSECQEGLQCVGDFMGSNTGYCSRPCSEPSECADLMAGSGAIEPSCQPDSPTMGTCSLDCSDAPEGCPDGMVCLDTNFFSRCGYPE